MRSEILNYLYLLRSILSFKGDRLGSGKEGVYVCWGWITRTGKSKLGDTRLEQHGGRSDLDHKDKL